MLRFLVVIFAIFLFGNQQTSFGQSDRKVVVLDMTNYNNETSSSRRLTPIRLMRLVGVPHDTTSNLATALQYPVIITGSRILQSAFSSAEISSIEDYVSNGGVFITSSMREPACYNLCGISDNTSDNYLYEIIFDTTSLDIFDYIDDSLEVKISIGDSANTPTFFTRYYTLDNALSLADYENGECAVAYNSFGSGHVYTFGPDFRDILYRNQANYDLSAHRTYSNGFEPTSDVIMFVIRNIIRKHVPNTIYKYTQPGTAKSTLLMTHDIDSKTGMDTMHIFSDYQESIGMRAQYNVTTRYLNDTWMSNFYVGSWPEVNDLLVHGHVLSSHSVGHFPDFNDDNIFPLGALGNTPNNYEPLYTGGITTGGTVLGELEVSRDLIEGDHSVDVRSYRSGHLCYPDSLILGLEMTGYEYNSTYSANDVLSSFPFYAIRIRSFNGEESNILEIPMTISDVFASDPINETNYPQKVAIWNDVTNRYHQNRSPIVLLIHPNRNWKLTAMQDYLSNLPSGLEYYNFEDYGDFWRKRDSLEFSTSLSGADMTVTIESSNLTPEQSFVLDYSGLDTVMFKDESGNSLDFLWIEWDHGSRLYYQEEDFSGINENNYQQQNGFVAYPNPTNELLNIYVNNNHYELHMYDLTGKLIYQANVSQSNTTIDLTILNIKPGTYILVANTDGEIKRQKIIFSE
jgi:hypothetical protein